MEIAKNFDFIQAENKWYQYWNDNGFFRSVPDHREPYTIVIPPPNVTGVLHMGHVLNNTIQDVLVRRARMQGKNACWVPGTDHASIATEAKVVAKLKSEGIEKKDISREDFLKHAWVWKEKYGGIILEQLKKLGASCDWERTKFTMDDDMSEAVIKVFVDLYNKGNIYRGVRMVNWDPLGKTALSDEEVNYKEVQSKLYYINYPIEGENGFVTVATTRPETILGDTAVCVNPNDERFQHLRNKKVIIPFVNRSVPVIFDEYVDIEFGTGCLKITPAHDINDYELGLKHHLPSIDILNDDGTLSEKAEFFVGEDRFVVRKKIVAELETMGLMVKTEDLVNKVGFSERTDAVIEPKLSVQWFMKMKTLAQPALDNVMNDTIQIIPEKFKNTYRHWMENVKDWCLSRQLWWGQRIPAFYLPNGEFVVAETIEEALVLAKAKLPSITKEDLIQDEDVLDTWFSSWLWPISVFDGIRNPENADIKYYYPTNDLVTAPEILFFWVARMIIAGYEYQHEKPFSNVYLTGIVRDKLGRKMSKSLGNSPDPLDLIDQYGADAIRIGMLLCSPAGNDLPFDDSLMEQGRNFNNKIWNSFRLIKTWEIDDKISQPNSSKVAIKWFNAKLNETIETINDEFSKYRISDALMATYRLFWDDYCSWYLECIKPGYQLPIDKVTYEETIAIFEKLLKLLHPFAPFITEELWHHISDKTDKDCIIVAEWPSVETYDKQIILDFDFVKETINSIRNIRKQKNIPNKEILALSVKANEEQPIFTLYADLISKLVNLSEISFVKDKLENAFTFIVRSTEFYIPLTENIDVEAEKAKLSEELKYSQGFLQSVLKKLANERFVAGAPANVLEMENKKKTDTEARIKVIQDQLASF